MKQTSNYVAVGLRDHRNPSSAIRSQTGPDHTHHLNSHPKFPAAALAFVSIWSIGSCHPGHAWLALRNMPCHIPFTRPVHSSWIMRPLHTPSLLLPPTDTCLLLARFYSIPSKSKLTRPWHATQPRPGSWFVAQQKRENNRKTPRNSARKSSKIGLLAEPRLPRARDPELRSLASLALLPLPVPVSVLLPPKPRLPRLLDQNPEAKKNSEPLPLPFAFVLCLSSSSAIYPGCFPFLVPTRGGGQGGGGGFDLI